MFIDTTNIYDPLQPPACIDCGYELTGLASECICPECGLKRDADVLMLRGFKVYGLRYRRVEVPTPKSAVMMCVFVTVYLVASIYWLHFVKGRLFLDSIILSVLGPLSGLTMHTIWRYQNSRSQYHPVNLLISERGVAQRTTFDPQVKWVPWPGLQLNRFELQRGYWRLILKKEDRFYLPAVEHHRGKPVAFEFQASNGTVAHVRALITRCIENSQQRPQPPDATDNDEAQYTAER